MKKQNTDKCNLSERKLIRGYRFLVGNSLKARFLRIMTIAITLCLVLIYFVTRFSWTIAQNSRVEAALMTTLQNIGDRIEDDYDGIVQISQNMIPGGVAGEKYNTFLTDELQFDRISDYRDFANSMSLIISGNDNVLLAAYFLQDSEDKDEILFSNFRVSEDFEPGELPVFIQTAEIVFHPIHQTFNSLQNKDVLSIMRPAVFGNGQEAVVYLEAKTDITDSLESKSELEGIDYVFLQLDADSRVIYSNSENFPIGMSIDVDETDMVRQNQYIGVTAISKYGFRQVLLLPLDQYTQQNNQWMRWIFGAVLISFAILAILVFSQIWLISRPVKALEERMEYLADGNFEVTKYHFGIKEFDHLFDVFNRMKVQIRSLMEKNEQQLREKSVLELEKLKYQINPHFLMNALNTVRWMALTNQESDITSYVNRLGYILSYSLGKVEPRTTLRSELKSLRNYLELQQMTYDYEFQIDVEEGSYLDQECARFILQPVAENSVCHNMDEFGHLWVRVWEEETRVCIAMEDDGKGFVLTRENENDKAGESRKNKGIGLQYLKMTLEAVYGDKAELRIDSEVGKGTKVQIILPKGDVNVSGFDN